MSQQISVEDAFPTFQKRCTELFEANLLLTARVDVLEKQLAAAQDENQRLKAAAEPPPLPGPDLSAKPLYDDGYDGES
jgi:hypothetical protein